MFEYDESPAEDVLALVCAELGGPRRAEWDASSCATPHGSRGGAPSLAPRLSEVEPETTTAEWKPQFGRPERLRTLGLALASLVSPTIGR